AETTPHDAGCVDEHAVISAAAEVGMPVAAVREAIAVERLGPRPPHRRLDPLVGPCSVVTERSIGVTADDAFRLLDRWLARRHQLRRQHLVRDDSAGITAVWRKRSDLAAGVQRGVRGVAGGASLGRVNELTCQIVPLGAEDRCVVRLVADRSVRRRRTLGASGTLGTIGLGAIVAGSAAASSVTVVLAPGVLVAGALAGVSKRAASGLERELERVLDQLANDPCATGRRRGRRGRA
ncbi:MAG: hypothetical protein KDB21_13495, partial [Acidimicrobiales bacterium]|nr:hypothetical protein [Acidimicrobiales bacterium]